MQNAKLHFSQSENNYQIKFSEGVYSDMRLLAAYIAIM